MAFHTINEKAFRIMNSTVALVNVALSARCLAWKSGTEIGDGALQFAKNRGQGHGNLLNADGFPSPQCIDWRFRRHLRRLRSIRMVVRNSLDPLPNGGRGGEQLKLDISRRAIILGGMANSTQNRRVDAVIFDIGGVLVRIDLSAALHAVEKFSPAALPGMLKLATDPVLLEFETGRISERDFHRHVERVVGVEFPFDAFCSCWNSILCEEIEPTLALFNDLRTRTELKIGILSNTNHIHFEWLRARISAFEGLDHVYASHQIGLRKPDRAAYEYVLKKMDVAPARAVFIDDLSENLDGARAAGLQVIHCTGPEAVRIGLADLGIFCADATPKIRRI
jgi:FMN phosphatase YigB (HAD superfamily)